jgi:hypothetical protein
MNLPRGWCVNTGMSRFRIALCVLLASSAARADMVSTSASSFFREATVVELLHVERVAGGQVTGVVTKVLRGNDPVGASVTLTNHAAPAVGATMLHACGPMTCVSSVDEGGVFVLDAGQVADASAVTPGVIVASSLGALVAGAPIPDLCVRATVHYFDDAKATAVIEAKVAAADGVGTATSTALRAGAMTATLFVGRGGTSNLDGPAATQLVLAHAAQPGHAALIAPAPQLASDGCLTIDGYPVHPLARTPRMFARALADQATETVIARGTLTVGEQGKAPIEIRSDRYGSLRWVSRVLSDESPRQTYGQSAANALHLPSATGTDRFLGIVAPDLAKRVASAPGREPVFALLPLLRPGKTVSWQVTEHGYNDDGTVVGSVVLTPVRDP